MNEETLNVGGGKVVKADPYIPVPVRRMATQDIVHCVHLGKLMHEESSYSFLSYHPVKVANLLKFSIENENYFAMVAENDRTIVGVMLGHVTPYYFSDDLIAQDLVVFVKKEHRGSFAGVSLINKFCDWADSKGCKETLMGITAGIETDRLKKLYEKLGFEQAGIVMKRRKS